MRREHESEQYASVTLAELGYVWKILREQGDLYAAAYIRRRVEQVAEPHAALRPRLLMLLSEVRDTGRQWSDASDEEAEQFLRRHRGVAAEDERERSEHD